LKITPMKPDDERVADQPIHGAADYWTRFDVPCKMTYSDNRITSIFEGTGISPERHPLTSRSEQAATSKLLSRQAHNRAPRSSWQPPRSGPGRRRLERPQLLGVEHEANPGHLAVRHI
jgi:hypothetical protein